MLEPILFFVTIAWAIAAYSYMLWRVGATYKETGWAMMLGVLASPLIPWTIGFTVHLAR